MERDHLRRLKPVFDHPGQYHANFVIEVTDADLASLGYVKLDPGLRERLFNALADIRESDEARNIWDDVDIVLAAIDGGQE